MIQTAAPEAGLYVECGSDKTAFQLHSESLRPRASFVCPVTTIRGAKKMSKSARRAQKRDKVRQMKEGHPKGDNRPVLTEYADIHV